MKSILIYCVMAGGYGDLIFAYRLYKLLNTSFQKRGVLVNIKLAINDVNESGVNNGYAKALALGIGIPQTSLFYMIMKHPRKTPSFYGTAKPQVDEVFNFDAYIIAPTITQLEYDLFVRAKYGLIFGRDEPTLKEIIVLDLKSAGFFNALRENTILLSVYNEDADEENDELPSGDGLSFRQPFGDVYLNIDFDFPMGLGPGRYGLLLTDINCEMLRAELPSSLTPGNFAMVYVNPESEDLIYYLLTFVLKIQKFMQKNNRTKFDLVMPKKAFFILKSKNLDRFMLKNFKFCENGTVFAEMMATRSSTTFSLNFKTDIFPVPYDVFDSLICFSAPPILLTGNQSVSSVISCCVDKDISIQADWWTESFINAVLQQPLTQIAQQWDFRRLGLDKLVDDLIKIFETNFWATEEEESEDDDNDEQQTKRIRRS